MKVAIIYGSVRTGRLGIRAAQYITEQCQARGWVATLVDPLDFKLPLLDKMYKEYDTGKAPDDLERLATIIKSADAYIVVSGEYNHTMPPALSNLMDHFMEEYFYKAAGIVSYSVGGFGGVRVADALRIFLGEVGLITASATLPISKIGATFDEKGKLLDEAYEARVDKFLNQFEWYAEALNEARAKGLPK